MAPVVETCRRQGLLDGASDASTATPTPIARRDNAGELAPSTPSGALFVAVSFCCVSPLLFGYSLSYTSPVEPTMTNEDKHGVYPPDGYAPFTDEQFGWYASLFNIGAVAGAFLGSALSESFGRKTTLAFTAFPHVVAWVGTALMSEWYVLTALRILSGVAVGIGSAVAPCYIGEVAPTDLRGALGAANQLSVTVGIFMVSLLGNDVFLKSVGSEQFSNWRVLAWSGAVLSLLLLGLTCSPESPSWFAKKGRTEDAKMALRRLRAGDCSKEAELLVPSGGGTATSTPMSGVTEEQQTSGSCFGELGMYWRSLVIGIGLCLFQQLSGVNAVMMYTTKICEQAHMQNAQLAATLSMGLQVILTGVACWLVERKGRRFLLLFASISMAVSHALLAVYYFAEANGHDLPSIVAMFALLLFIIGFSLGLGPIPWLILAEIFPVNVRGVASSLATAVNWFTSFVVTLLFQPLQDAITPQGTFLLFAVVCLLCFVFVLFNVPETKGKTVDQVLAELNNRGARTVAMGS